MNDNTELLTWAVENITEWNDDYTHLRSDVTEDSPFYTAGIDTPAWDMRKYSPEWCIDVDEDEDYWHYINKQFNTNVPQVITKQEWQDAKLRNAFNTVLKMRHSSSKADNTAQDGSESQGEALQGHIHAELMAEYAEVALTNPDPWEEFEKGILDDNGQLEWVSMTLLDAFESWHNYRRKPSPPKTMNIGGVVVEVYPIEEHLEDGDTYFLVEFTMQRTFAAYKYTWGCDGLDAYRIVSGKAFSTKEQAQAVADALNKVYNDALVGWKGE